MIRLLIYLMFFSVSIYADPRDTFDLKGTMEGIPYAVEPLPKEKMPKYLRMMQEGMNGHFLNYKAHFNAVAFINVPGHKRFKYASYMTQDEEIVPVRFIDWTKERPILSDRSLDVYISFKLNFFVLDAQLDYDLYTVDGRFYRNEDNVLCTIAHGLPVMGKDGYIYLETDDPIIDEKGRIYENDELVGQLQIASFTKAEGLWTIDGTVFYQREPHLVEYSQEPVDYGLIQGFYEAQNEPPGMKTTLTIVPFAEGLAKSTKMVLDSYESMFRAVID